MLEVNSGQTNSLTTYNRYNRINKFEIYDHNTKITTSGETSITGYFGKIIHTGITYSFTENNLYTYTTYFKYDEDDQYYLCNQTLVKSWKDDERVDDYIVIDKEDNRFKVRK